MAIHNASLYWILNDAEHFGDWSYVAKAEFVFWPGMLIYALGHVELWTLYMFKFRSRAE